MGIAYSAIGSFNTTSTDTVTLTHPNTPSANVIAVAALDSGHPTGTNIPEPVDDGWVFVRTIVGTAGTYGVDSGPRRITIYMRWLQDGDEDTVQFTMPTGTDSRLGGVIVHLTNNAAQPVVRYQFASGEDVALGTSFSAALSPSIEYDSAQGELVLIHYVVNTDTSYSAEAITATGITFGTVTERGDSASTVGADAGRAIATAGVSAGAGIAATTVTATCGASVFGVAAVVRLQDRGDNTGPATITATYDDAAGLVELEVDRLDPNSTLVDIERSVDQIRWTTVRGAAALAIGETLVVNDTFTRSVSDGLGSTDTGQAWATTGGAAADYDVNGTQATVALPDTASRTALVSMSVADSTVRAEVIVPATATGGSYRAGVLARATSSTNYYQLRASPDTSSTVDLVIEKAVAGVFTTIATLNNAFAYAPADEIGFVFECVGERLRGKVWNATTGSEPTDWTLEAIDDSHTTGGFGFRSERASGNTNVGLVLPWDNFSAMQRIVSLNDYEYIPGMTNYYRVTSYNEGLLVGDIETTSVAITQDGIWIKSVTRPFLNIFIAGGCSAVGDSDTEMLVSDDVVRPTRSNVFPIVNRTYGIAVNDIGRGRQWTVKMRTHTLTALRTLDYLVASGDVILIQVPAGCGDTIPNGYVTFYDAGYSRPHKRRRQTAVWTIPVEEVAPPGPDVVYAEATWATVIAQYATWADLVAANPTWADVLALLPTPSEVIVP